jgi:hypothetical protein
VSVITVDTINLKVALVVDNHSKRSLYWAKIWGKKNKKSRKQMFSYNR